MASYGDFHFHALCDDCLGVDVKVLAYWEGVENTVLCFGGVYVGGGTTLHFHACWFGG